MVQINDFEWKDGTMLPECSLTHLGIETSHEVIAVIEDNGYRSTLVLQYHLRRGWEYANGVELKAVFKDAVILQWSYIGGRTLRPPLKETRDYDLPQDDRPRPGETAKPGSGGRPYSAGL